MGQPKKQKSPRKTGLGRSHLVLDLARRVNATSPVKIRTTKRETGKKPVPSVLAAAAAERAPKAAPKTKKPAATAK